MKLITIADIRALNPCYDPTRYVPETWSGTVADILRASNVPAEDRVWVATELLDDKTNRLFAVWCAREALKLVENPDARSIAACDIAERFANGLATEQELAAAMAAARAVAWDAAMAAARAAAWAAAWGAACGAAWDAAKAAARDAARNAAMGAAWGAAWDAAWDAAWGAAWGAAWEKQCEHLAMMVEWKEVE